MIKRWKVWRHDCFDAGCEPMCDDPWQVDAGWPHIGAVFATWAEAFAYADKESRSK